MMCVVVPFASFLWKWWRSRSDSLTSIKKTTCTRINSFGRRTGLHLVVAAEVHVAGQREAGGEEQLSFHHLGPDIFLQVGSAQTAVPVVCDVPSVHNLTKQVAQVVKWHLGFRGGGVEGWRGRGGFVVAAAREVWPVVFSRGHVRSDFQLRLQRALFVILLCGQ